MKKEMYLKRELFKSQPEGEEESGDGDEGTQSGEGV